MNKPTTSSRKSSSYPRDLPPNLLKDKRLLVACLLTLTVIAGVIAFIAFSNTSSESSPADTDSRRAITNFDECVAAGNPIMEIYPEQCAANGQTFVKEY